MLQKLINKKVLIILLLVQITVSGFLIHDILQQRKTLASIKDNKAKNESNQKKNSNTKETNSQLSKEKKKNETIIDNKIVGNNEIKRKYNFINTLYNFDSGEEYYNNVMNFFGREKYLRVFLFENSVENLKSYHAKNSDIYINVDKNILYGFFDKEFIYMSIERHKDKYRLKRPGVLYGNL